MILKNYYLSLTLVFIFHFNHLLAQDARQDSILQLIKKETDNKKIFKHYIKLANLNLAKDEAKEELYLNKAIFYAELTRDRDLILEAYIAAIDQWYSIRNQEQRTQKAFNLANIAMPIAIESNNYEKMTILSIKKAVYFRHSGKINEALKYNEDAVNYAQFTENDSLKINVDLSFANTLIEKDDNLSAFKKYMNALDNAEKIKNNFLIYTISSKLGDFYTKIEQKEKAKDFYIKALNIAQKDKKESLEFASINSLIGLHAANKEFNIAREYLELLKLKSKNTKDELYKYSGIFAEVNLLFSEDIKRVPDFMKKNPEIMSELLKWGFKREYYSVLALGKSIENKKDSAEYYFKLSKNELNANSTPYSLISHNGYYAFHLDRIGNYKEAIKYTEESLNLSKKIGSLIYQKSLLESLDTLYTKANNNGKVLSNKIELYAIKDSLDKQKKEKDLLNIEIEIENRRNERLKQEEDAALIKKHNLQYMGITAGIISVFIVLLILGKYKIRPWIIKALGFLSFIMLFEFIILLADKQIHHITHGDPLSMLLIKIVLIAILMPLHHYLEHRVIHHLMKHRNDIS